MASIFCDIDRRINKSSQFWHNSEESPQSDLEQHTIHEGYLSIPTQHSVWKERKFVLTTSAIYYYEENGNISPLRSFIVWKHAEAFIEETSNIKRYGFRIYQGRFSQDFYTFNSNDLDIWMSYLSRICILSDLEDNYEIIKDIGKGKYAEVYLARDLDNGKKYAIKSIAKDLIEISSRGVSGTINEIEIMRKLKHPYVTSLHKVYESQSKLCTILG